MFSSVKPITHKENNVLVEESWFPRVEVSSNCVDRETEIRKIRIEKPTFRMHHVKPSFV